jgi:tRNA/tmRNA/rRNA uracil-C5-methylase (TrmA/RlmC/RlmD family)
MNIDMETNPELTNFFSSLDSAGLILVIGYSGSGKSQLIFSYLDYLSKKYTPDEFMIVAYDVVRVDYWEKEPVMPWTKVVDWKDDGYRNKILSDIQFVKDRKSGKIDSKQRVLIHINECDLFQKDFRESVIELCELVAESGKDINVQLIYETSRPVEPALPVVLVKVANVKIMCPVANTVDAQYFLGTEEGLPEKQGQIKVKIENAEGFNDYDFYLPR